MVTVLAVLVPGATFCVAQAPESGKKAQTAKKAASVASLTGCVDETEGHYVLVDDRNLTPVADLEADGFPTEGFAKHVGHKVTVRGTSNSGSSRPVFKVRSIETVAKPARRHPSRTRDKNKR